jgi:hypothetical protein
MSWKKLLLTIVLWFVSVILHNMVDAFFGVEEALFFILAVFVLPLYLIVSLVFTLVNFLLKMKNK